MASQQYRELSTPVRGRRGHSDVGGTATTKYSMEVIDVLVVGSHQPESSWWIGTWLSLGTKFRLARVTWTSFDVV
jgi:hypothetical protein